MNQLIPVGQTVNQTIVLAWGAGLLAGIVAGGMEASLESALTRWQKKQGSSWGSIITRKAPIYAACYSVAAGGYVIAQISDPSITLEVFNQMNLKIGFIMSTLMPILNVIFEQADARLFKSDS
jgi:hypothetical protein